METQSDHIVKLVCRVDTTILLLSAICISILDALRCFWPGCAIFGMLALRCALVIVGSITGSLACFRPFLLLSSILMRAAGVFALIILAAATFGWNLDALGQKDGAIVKTVLLLVCFMFGFRQIRIDVANDYKRIRDEKNKRLVLTIRFYV